MAFQTHEPRRSLLTADLVSIVPLACTSFSKVNTHMNLLLSHWLATRQHGLLAQLTQLLHHFSGNTGENVGQEHCETSVKCRSMMIAWRDLVEVMQQQGALLLNESLCASLQVMIVLSQLHLTSCAQLNRMLGPPRFRPQFDRIRCNCWWRELLPLTNGDSHYPSLVSIVTSYLACSGMPIQLSYLTSRYSSEPSLAGKT